jgi:AraC-like DNA-binding protein
MHHYVLKQEFILKRQANAATNMLTIKFDCRAVGIKSNGTNIAPLFALRKGGEVELGTGNFFTEVRIPPDQQIDFLVVGTTRQTLLGILKLGTEGYAIESMIRDNLSFLLHEGMSREMEKTLKQISQITENTKMAELLYQAKALELIYLLFNKLLSRTASTSLTINQADAERIYEIKDDILTDLSQIPQLPQLASKAGMSLTKMKQLFHQIFGDSIYNYYQTARMEEAANLLNYLTVSEAGYKVGFTNLSHFSRLFEKHHQMKPKRFKDSLQVA